MKLLFLIKILTLKKTRFFRVLKIPGTEPATHSVICSIPCLAFHCNVESHFVTVRDALPAELDPIADYFQATYIRRLSAYRREERLRIVSSRISICFVESLWLYAGGYSADQQYIGSLAQLVPRGRQGIAPERVCFLRRAKKRTSRHKNNIREMVISTT